MFKFRGQRKVNGEWVVGGLTRGYVNDELRYVYHVEDDELNLYLDIQPGTLSVSTGKLDSNGVEIFASFEIDGVMTEGGDVVSVPRWSHLGGMEVKYSKLWSKFSVGHFELSSADSNEITIIPKEATNDK